MWIALILLAVALLPIVVWQVRKQYSQIRQAQFHRKMTAISQETNPYDGKAPETAAESVAMLNTIMRNVNAATRDRKIIWLYKITEDSPQEVATFFSKPVETPYRVGKTNVGDRIVAIWNGPEAEPTEEPVFT